MLVTVAVEPTVVTPIPVPAATVVEVPPAVYPPAWFRNSDELPPVVRLTPLIVEVVNVQPLVQPPDVLLITPPEMLIVVPSGFTAPKRLVVARGRSPATIARAVGAPEPLIGPAKKKF
jgi:hypothetical protein